MEPGVVYSATSQTLAEDHLQFGQSAQHFALIKVGNYAEGMRGEEVHMSGKSAIINSGAADIYIYTRSGEAEITVQIQGSPDENLPIESGSVLHIRSHESYRITAARDLVLFIVSVPDISGPYARKQVHESKNFRRKVQQGLTPTSAATSDREYEVLFDAQSGSGGATMFVGFIPPSGAPAHYHLYDEICQIIKGSGQLLVGTTSQPLTEGSTFAIVPRLLHSVVNNTSENLWILGTFRPEGSPAAAYYPDGKPAPGYIEAF